MKYSICITCRNEATTIRRSLNSILNQIDDRFEIVIVDGSSNDGTYDIIREYAILGKLRLFTRKCSRGLGRQIAFENSSGNYIISNIDMDDVFEPLITSLIDFYHQKCEGNLLLAILSAEKRLRGIQNITISTRSLLSKLGGWEDLQYFEDWSLWSRAAKIGKYNWTEFPLLEQWNLHPERNNFWEKMKHRYLRYRDLSRLGVDLFSEDDVVNLKQKFFALAAKIGKTFFSSYEDPFNKLFDPYSNKYKLSP